MLRTSEAQLLNAFAWVLGFYFGGGFGISFGISGFEVCGLGLGFRRFCFFFGGGGWDLWGWRVGSWGFGVCGLGLGFRGLGSLGVEVVGFGVSGFGFWGLGFRASYHYKASLLFIPWICIMATYI